MSGFGTHNGWAAFRGWFWAKLIRKNNVSWKTSNRPGMFPYHVVHFDEEKNNG